MEQLILIAIFLLAGLVNLLVRWLRRNVPAPAPEEEPAPARPLELPPAVRLVVPPPHAAPVPAARRAPARPPAALRRPPRGLLGSRADARRGIVAMTVLGPCRAREEEAEVRTPGPAGL